VKQDKSRTITISELPETLILKEYNQTLICKLEDKMRQTEENEKKLKRYVKELEESLEAQKKTEEALRLNEQQLTSIYNTVGDVIYYLAVEPNNIYRFVTVNPAFSKVTGIPTEFLIGKLVTEVIPQPSLNLVLGNYNLAIKEKKLVRWEETSDYPTGRLTGEVSIRPVFDSNGICSHIVGSVHDITERKQFENAIRNSEENFRSIYENSTLGIYRTTPENKILMASPAFISMLGFTSFEDLFAARNSTDDFYIHQEDRQLFKKIIEENGVIHGFETEWKKADGTQITIRNSSKAIKDNKDNTLYYEGTVENITEQKELEKKMRLLAHSLESVSECVSITDKDDIILFVNDSFQRTYGYKENELIGKHISIVRPKEGTHLENFSGILKDTIGGGWKGEILNQKKDGALFPVSLSTSIIKDHKNNPIALIGVATDITEMKKAREELIKAKEMAEKSDRLKTEFLAQMSHEIRTPINIITSSIEYIQSTLEGNISEELNDIFNAIDLSSQRIIRTIELILNMAEIQTGNFETNPVLLDINSDILVKLCSEHKRFAMRENIEFTYLNKAKHTEVFADEYCVTQIFANLIGNAIKYTDTGIINVELINTEKGEIEVSVTDTGIGISEDFLAKIFQPFSQEEQGYSRSYEGNGLGLAIVKKYCELNNAEIKVESRKGAGSTFTITFQAAKHEGI